MHLMLSLATAIALAIAAVPAAAQQTEKKVVSLDPLWLPTQLRERGGDRAALSMCGGDLHSCAEATQLLRSLTAQCSNVFLGIIDLGVHPGVPKNLYDAEDSKFIIFLKEQGSKVLAPVRLMANVSPDTVAIAMCPEESRAFGNVLRMLRMKQP